MASVSVASAEALSAAGSAADATFSGSSVTSGAAAARRLRRRRGAGSAAAASGCRNNGACTTAGAAASSFSAAGSASVKSVSPTPEVSADSSAVVGDGADSAGFSALGAAFLRARLRGAGFSAGGVSSGATCSAASGSAAPGSAAPGSAASGAVAATGAAAGSVTCSAPAAAPVTVAWIRSAISRVRLDCALRSSVPSAAASARTCLLVTPRSLANAWARIFSGSAGVAPAWTDASTIGSCTFSGGA